MDTINQPEFTVLSRLQNEYKELAERQAKLVAFLQSDHDDPSISFSALRLLQQQLEVQQALLYILEARLQIMQSDLSSKLRQDEGCPHHSVEHVCVSTTVVPRGLRWPSELDGAHSVADQENAG